ncbi:hypothetical protein RIF29_15445 [Crotalaria pallida]|uniref:Uncharacterized protein n=1 Tax=Crotalaria pallida TaxID=3830 RepID=A0AAN9IEM8_CROPI
MNSKLCLSKPDPPTFARPTKIVDKVGATGFLVVVSDLLYGDYFDFDNPEFDRESWAKAHGAAKGFEDTKPIIAAFKSKGVTAIGLQVSVGEGLCRVEVDYQK